MSTKAVGVAIAVALGITGAYFLLQSDTTILKKKTVKLLEPLAPGTAETSQLALIRKVNQTAKYAHFSIQYEVEWERYSHKDRSLANLKRTLMGYFQKSRNGKINIPAKKDITVSVSKKDDKKLAEVRFSLTALWQKKQVTCAVLLNWEKQKKWLIHKAKVHNCSPIANAG